MSNQDSIFYKRNLAVPFFTQRDNTYQAAAFGDGS